MAKVRLGVVLLVPPPVEREVDALRRACGDGALGRVPAHCTLVPPVNVRDDRMMDALDALRAAASATRPFRVVLGPPATFLPDNPTLHLPVSGPGAEALQALRHRVFVEPLARSLTHAFVPHVTLADEMAPERIAAAVAALAGYRAEVTFERVHLLEEGTGRVWAPVAEAAFGAPIVVGRGGLPVDLAVTDLPDVEALAFAEREWPLQHLADHGPRGLEPRRPVALTARREGAVVGLAEGWTHDGVAFLDRLLVGAEHRGQGIGSHLLAAFESLAAERGCDRLALDALEGSRAEAFYRHRGWTEEHRVGHWVHGTGRVRLRRDR